MAKQHSPDGRLVYLHCSSIFSGANYIIGLSLPVLALSSYYLYIGSFIWPTVKIGAFFFGVKYMSTSFPNFLLLPILLLPVTASSPTQPQQRHIKVQQDLQYIIERNWSVKKNSWRPAYSEDAPVKRAELALLSRLPQCRYRIALPILPNTCGATSDPSNSCAFRSLNWTRPLVWRFLHLWVMRNFINSVIKVFGQQTNR